METNLLDHYVDITCASLEKLSSEGEAAAAAAAGVAEEGGEDRCEAIVQTLCSLFIARPDKLSAFLKFKVFETLLVLGSRRARASAPSSCRAR